MLSRFLYLLANYLTPWAHRSLIWQFARRDVLGRYRGSYLGVCWSFVSPLVMLAVYTFVFVVVFKARWPGAESGGGIEFAIQLLAGLIVFNLFADLCARAPRLILDQGNLVKKVVFPLEILPWISLLSALFHLLLNTLTLMAAIIFVRGSLPVTALAFPLILLVFIPFLLGLSWFLSSLGVFIRDVGQFIPMVVNLIMFLSPVFYAAKSLPESFQGWMRMNPLSLMIESSRQTLLQGVWPDWQALLLYTAMSLSTAFLGAAFFHLTRKGFADVI
jgi:lipopolysaccharide transport system permease protein